VKLKDWGMLLVLNSLVTLAGCAASRPELLTYLALDKPRGRIENAPQRSVWRSFHRGGFFAFNVNFRPAADLGKYLGEVEREAGSPILRQADVRLHTPFAIKFWPVGYNEGEDTVIAGGQPGQ
jgi:hypothetical protein